MPPRKRAASPKVAASVSAAAAASESTPWVSTKRSRAAASASAAVAVRNTSQSQTDQQKIDQSVFELKSFARHSTTRLAIEKAVYNTLCPVNYDPKTTRPPIGILPVCHLISGYALHDTAREWYVWCINEQLTHFRRLAVVDRDATLCNSPLDEHVFWLEMRSHLSRQLMIPKPVRDSSRVVTFDFDLSTWSFPTFQMNCLCAAERTHFNSFVMSLRYDGISGQGWTFHAIHGGSPTTTIRMLLDRILPGTMKSLVVPSSVDLTQAEAIQHIRRSSARLSKSLTETEEATSRIVTYTALRLFLKYVLRCVHKSYSVSFMRTRDAMLAKWTTQVNNEFVRPEVGFPPLPEFDSDSL